MAKVGCHWLQEENNVVSKAKKAFYENPYHIKQISSNQLAKSSQKENFNKGWMNYIYDEILMLQAL